MAGQPRPSLNVKRVLLPATLLLLTALAVWPVLRAGYPTLGDGLIHYYRLVEFSHLLGEGVWFPRWASDLGYGYGLPLFNFYPPLTYYLGALFHALGLNIAHSLLAVYAVAWALAVTGAYALARQQGGPLAGLLAAAAYGLAPYLYFNALARGAVPETLGLGLLPWVLWGFGRLKDESGRMKVILPAVLFATLVLTHLLTAVLALPLLVFFALLPNGNSIRTHKSKIIPLLLAGLLGLGLSAYFLLPAVLETNAVQVHQLTAPGDLNFRNNFLSLSALFAWPRPFDPRQVFHEVPPSLSLAAVALTGAGLVLALGRRRILAQNAALWAALGLYAVFSLPVTQPLWEVLPGAEIVQFPWRLVGPASLLLALVVNGGFTLPALSASSTVRERVGISVGIFLISVTSLWLFSLTWTFAPRFEAPPAPATPAGLAVYERVTGQLGTTSTGEFLPAAVRELPPDDGLAAAYALAAVPVRLNAVPAGVTVQRQSATVTGTEAVVNAATPAWLTFDLFYFPGWQATVDGAAVAITPSTPHGFVTVPVPAGTHTVAVQFGNTPVRAAAAAISLVALAVVIVVGVQSALRRTTAEQRLAPKNSRPTRNTEAWGGKGAAETWQAYVPVLTVVVLFIVRVTALDGRETVFARTRFDGATVTGVKTPLDVNFDDQLVLLGYDTAELTMPADGELPLTLYWRAQNVPAVDYSTTMQVLDAEGNLWGQADSQHPGRVPTSRWPTDQYAEDLHVLNLIVGAPPGEYGVFAGVYQVNGPALSVLDPERVPRGQLYRLGTLTVTERQGAQPLPGDNVTQSLLDLGPLQVGVAVAEPVTVQAGSETIVEVYWTAQGATRPTITAHWEIVAGDGQTLTALDAPPAHTGWPTSEWPAGETVRGVYRLRVPADAPAGNATVRISLFDAATGAALSHPGMLVALTLSVPERTFAEPPSMQRLDAALGPQVTLLGYEVGAETVTLYWQTSTVLDDSYTGFVHALAADGTLMAQADQVPAGGARPTTGWLPGEVVADTYRLPPAGATRLRAGLYDPQTGERLGEVLMPIP